LRLSSLRQWHFPGCGLAWKNLEVGSKGDCFKHCLLKGGVL
jgi:hypothetical protein